MTKGWVWRMCGFKQIGAVVGLLGLAGCASIEVGTGFDEVSGLVVERGGATLHAVDNPDKPLGVDLNAHANPKGAISLDRALHIALTNSPALQAEYARLAISRADVFQASLLKNPTFDTSVVAGITGDPTRFTLGAVYPVLDLVYRKPRIKAARADFRATQIEVAEGIIDHANKVTSAYLNLAQAKARLKARQEVVNVARSQLQAIERLVAAGTIDGSVIAELQATLTEAEIERGSERGERDAARIQLAGLIGSPLKTKLDTTLVLENIGKYSATAQALRAQAHRQRLDLIRAEQEVTVRKFALKKAGRLFDEDSKELGLELENEEGERFLGPSISVEVPIFDRGKYRKVKANAELIEAERRLKALKHSIDAEVLEAHQRVSTRKTTALAHRNRLIPSTRTRAALARERFNTGTIEASDFLEAQLAISEAKLEAIDAAADYWEARVDLAQAIGGWPSKI